MPPRGTAPAGSWTGNPQAARIIAAGLRMGETSHQLTVRINKELGLSLGNGSIIGALQPGRPLEQLILKLFKEEGPRLLEQFRTGKTETPLQAAKRELKEAPAALMQFSCSALIFDEETSTHRPCGKVTRKPQCSTAHRIQEQKRLAADYASRARRVA